MPSLKSVIIKRPLTRRLAALLWLLISVSGCAGHRATPAPAPLPSLEVAAGWAAHQRQLHAFEAWTVVARLALQSGTQSSSASLHWRQQQQHYLIRLSGILGIGLTTIEGDVKRITVTTPKQQLSTSGDLQQWLHQQLGFRIPVAQLRWWLRGVLAPEAISGSAPQHHKTLQYRLNAQGRLLELQQHGWRIQYRRYARFDGLDLPTRIRLQYTPPSSFHADPQTEHAEQTELRLVIRRWESAS